MKFEFENLKDKYLSLPPTVQEAISSVEIADSIYSIGQKNDLQIDEMGELAQETGMVLLGMTRPEKFEDTLRQRLPRISAEKIQKIVGEINDEVFREIKSALVEMYAEKPVPKQETGAPQGPHGVEHTMPGDIAKTKLEQSFRMPPQNTTVNLGNQTKQAPASGVDPYREPTA